MFHRQTTLNIDIKKHPTYPIENLTIWGFDITNVQTENNLMTIHYLFSVKNIKLNIKYNENEKYAIAYMVKYDSMSNCNINNTQTLTIDISKINYFTFTGYVIKIPEILNPTYNTNNTDNTNNINNTYYSSIKNWLFSFYYTNENTTEKVTERAIDNITDKITDNISTELYDADDIMKRQYLYNKFNLKFAEFNIQMYSFTEKYNKYQIECNISGNYNIQIIYNKNYNNINYNNNNNDNNDNSNSIVNNATLILCKYKDKEYKIKSTNVHKLELLNTIEDIDIKYGLIHDVDYDIFDFEDIEEDAIELDINDC